MALGQVFRPKRAAVAAGVEYERWSLEQVVEMTDEYFRGKEDAKFEAAFLKLSNK